MSDLRKCADYIYAALVNEMADRSAPEWEENERVAVAIAANQWTQAHPPAMTVTVEDVERVESMAVGHVDYARKLSLYVAELVHVSGGQFRDAGVGE